MRIRCRAGSKFLGEGGFRTGPPSCRHGVVARAGVLPQLATAAHPCAARPPWRQDGVLPARRGRGFDRCPGLAAIEHSAEIMERRQRRAASAVTPSIEATTPKIPEDAVSWGEGPSGTWMCHDPSKDRMSSRGMGPLPRARRPLPKPKLQPASPKQGGQLASAFQAAAKRKGRPMACPFILPARVAAITPRPSSPRSSGPRASPAGPAASHHRPARCRGSRGCRTCRPARPRPSCAGPGS